MYSLDTLILHYPIMLNYYKEKIELLEKQIDLAKSGLAVKMRWARVDMSTPEKFDAVRAKLEQAQKGANAIKSLEKDLGYYKAFLDKKAEENGGNE